MRKLLPSKRLFPWAGLPTVTLRLAKHSTRMLRQARASGDFPLPLLQLLLLPNVHTLHLHMVHMVHMVGWLSKETFAKIT